MRKIADSEGLESLGHFLVFMDMQANTKEYRLLSGENYFSISGEKNQHRVNQAVNYIVDLYQENLSPEEVAKELGMQPTYFSRFFRQATGRCFMALKGMTPSDYRRLSAEACLVEQGTVVVSPAMNSAGLRIV